VVLGNKKEALCFFFTHKQFTFFSCELIKVSYKVNSYKLRNGGVIYG